MSFRFEWDKNKAEANVGKHRVDFEEAATVFNDPLARIFDDEEHSSGDEVREIIIGRAITNRLLLVCFTERTQDVIRIFSARLVTKKEHKDYEENTTR